MRHECIDNWHTVFQPAVCKMDGFRITKFNKKQHFSHCTLSIERGHAIATVAAAGVRLVVLCIHAVQADFTVLQSGTHVVCDDLDA